MRYIYFCFLILSFSKIYCQNICIQLNHTSQITDAALQDFKNLIQKSGLNIVGNSDKADVTLVCEIIIQNNISGKDKENFFWVKNSVNEKLTFSLTANSEKGIANGLYAFLQEQLEFNFFHPRKMNIPNLKKFDFNKLTNFSGKKSFEHIGFHLHTMHPIELTEDLLDETREESIANVFEYIDWLARNGQNYFEFNLLESINRKNWISHAQKITNYAHARGISCGIDISLHMLQQKAFQLYKNFPASFLSKSLQVKKNATWLLTAGFDLWNIELSATEFTAGHADKKSKILEELQKIAGDQVKIMSRTHVVQETEMLDKKEKLILPRKHGLMIHTVMFYGLTDSVAPVYRNKNLLHQQHSLLKSKEERETWYYPESAYWVTFDNSVPMFLLPYFDTRLQDIQFCAENNIDGHLTFSSGWEWGYWSIDWSIARNCWKFYHNDTAENQYSTKYLQTISLSESFRSFICEQEKLHNSFIKNQELIRVLDAQTVTDEIFKPLNIEFHPRPKFAYPYIRNEASLKELDTVKILYIKPLQEFIKLSQKSFKNIKPQNEEEKEIFDALKITELRAQHKLKTLQYIVELRENKLLDKKKKLFIQDAEKIRKEALQIVERREKKYKYPVPELTTKHKDHTAYHFGYLYPVHKLHFWKREENQAVKNKYSFLFKNIWNVFRIIGLIN